MSDTAAVGSRNRSQQSKELENRFVRLVRKRYGFGMLLVLLLWVPLGSIRLLEGIMGNVFLLDSYLQLAFLTSTNAMAVVFGFAITRVLNNRFPGKSFSKYIGDGSRPWEKNTFCLAILVASATPCFISIWYASEFSGVIHAGAECVSMLEHLVLAPIAIVIGLAFAAIFLFAMGRIKCWLFGSEKETSNFLPFETLSRKGLLPTGLFETIENQFDLEDIDIHLAIYLVLLGASHYLFTRVFVETNTSLTTAPAAAIVLIWIVFLFLGGAANVLDRYRLPVVLLIIVAVSLVQAFRPSTSEINTAKDSSVNHFSKTISKIRSAEEAYLEGSGNQLTRVDAVMSSAAQLNDRAWEAVQKRMEQANGFGKDNLKTLVIVTCPGGGIHAAAWASFVLDQLCDEYPDFRDSICVVSGVSGGSVGSLLFVAEQYQDVLGEFKNPPRSSFDLATQSSLEAIAFGMMSDDLYGSIIPFLSQTDRGQRLEESIHRRLPKEQQQLTMGQWGDLAVEGKLPVVIFNSTDASSGRRVLFDSIPTPRRISEIGKISRPYNYRELVNQSFDVLPATAARTSATFPYVSPFTRPRNSSDHGREVALCDGGYVDNEGIVTAIDWIDFITTRWYPIRADNDKSSFDRILLLRIAPSPSADGMVPLSKHAAIQATRWMLGPLETMVSVRGTSQSERGNLESDLAATYLTPNTNVETTEEPAFPKPRSTLPMFPNSTDAAAKRKYQFRKSGKMAPLNENIPAAGADIGRGIDEKDGSQSQGWDSEETVGSMFDPSSEGERPVIVVEVPFDTGVERVIPLNWKLSRKQKTWYSESWSQIFFRGSKSSQKGELTRILDQFFRQH